MRGLRRTKRRLPHWELDGSLYFVTFRTHGGFLSQAERDVVFDRIVDGDRLYYSLHAVVVMPDHVHFVIKLRTGYTLSRITKGVKGVTARRINQLRGRRSIVWLDESYDRIVRDPEEYYEKLKYIAENPYRSGDVSVGEKYPWVYVSPEG